MSESDTAPSAPPVVDESAPCESPPPAPTPQREEPSDPRSRLLQLAAELMRSQNRRLVVEYLRLRRAI